MKRGVDSDRQKVLFYENGGAVEDVVERAVWFVEDCIVGFFGGCGGPEVHDEDIGTRTADFGGLERLGCEVERWRWRFRIHSYAMGLGCIKQSTS